MNGFFSVDSPFFKVCSKIADIFLLNLIFVITCIPVVTIGASLTALHAISAKMIRGEEGYIIKGYWKEFRAGFKRSTMLFLVLAFVGGVLGADYYFWNSVGGNIGAVMLVITIIVACLYIMVWIYAFPMEAVFGYSVLECVKKSILMAVYRLPITVLFVIYYGAILYFALQYVIADLFLAVFGFGLTAMGSAVLYLAAFQKIINNQE